MGEPQTSLFSFLMEPMVALEPGIAENHDMLTSFNTELEENIVFLCGYRALAGANSKC